MIVALIAFALAGEHTPAFISHASPTAPARYRELPERQRWLQCQRQAADRLATDPRRQRMLRTFWPIQSARLLFSDLDEDTNCQAEFQAYAAIRDGQLSRELRSDLRNDDWNDILLFCAQVVERRHLHREEHASNR